MNRLKTRLILTYIIISMITVAMASIMSNIMLDKVFRIYVTNTQEKKIAQIIRQITEQHSISDRAWSYDVLNHIGKNALGNGMIIEIKAEDESILWSAWEYNGGECSAIL